MKIGIVLACCCSLFVGAFGSDDDGSAVSRRDNVRTGVKKLVVLIGGAVAVATVFVIYRHKISNTLNHIYEDFCGNGENAKAKLKVCQDEQRIILDELRRRNDTVSLLESQLKDARNEIEENRNALSLKEMAEKHDVELRGMQSGTEAKLKELHDEYEPKLEEGVEVLKAELRRRYDKTDAQVEEIRSRYDGTL
jgi:hypothetical protein